MNNHTGKELQLMLEDKKPLSMFYDDADAEPDERIIPEREFTNLVEDGRFSKAERIFEVAYDPRIGRNRRVRYVLYCLKGEEWRLEAMFLVKKAVQKTPDYDEGLGRMTGYLLGYTDDEVEAYIASRTKG
jgi:hypothetical protein